MSSPLKETRMIHILRYRLQFRSDVECYLKQTEDDSTRTSAPNVPLAF